MKNEKGNEKAAAFSAGELVEVLLTRPFDAGFDYIVPQGMTLRVGSYVSVSFGSRSMIGVVWGDGAGKVAREKCKPIEQHHDHLPPMPAPLRQLIDWCASYTLSPKGLVLKMALSAPEAIVSPESESCYKLQHVEAGQLTPPRRAIISALQQHEMLPRRTLMAQTGASSAVIAAMVKAGMLSQMQLLAAPSVRPPFVPLAAPPLREEQAAASEAIKQCLPQLAGGGKEGGMIPPPQPSPAGGGGGFAVFALEGVTGSGKTEVYFDVISALLESGAGQVLVLLPEIALTMQWMQRFEARFGAVAALWHSSVSQAKRKRIWQKVADGSAPLVVGARSALFLPFRDLQLMIVDEEHEPSYKQEDGVLYQARDMAVARAKHEQIPLLLCSATLSLETQHNVQQGKYALLSLKERHGEYHEPTPQLIDLRSDAPERGAFIAPSLRAAIAQSLEHGHQSMLFLNRRGYAPLLLCRSCGHRFACPNCSAYMVQHRRPPRLDCHHCGWTQTLPTHCPACQSEELVASGPGVERIAEEVSALFPQARCVTLSSDEAALQAQIESVIAGQADIIIGTQLVAKGHHFAALEVVGVIDGDVGLDGGDLRAGERSYQLLHQLAGRAGRERVAGRVFIQTTQPQHPLMQALAANDRIGFMAAEMQMREAGGWPPYGRLAALLLEGFDEAAVRAAAQQLIACAPRFDNVRYLGPAPAAIARIRNRYRYRILVKASKEVALSPLIRSWVAQCSLAPSVRLKVDIDPYSFL